jgi:hypothetical protein
VRRIGTAACAFGLQAAGGGAEMLRLAGGRAVPSSGIRSSFLTFEKQSSLLPRQPSRTVVSMGMGKLGKVVIGGVVAGGLLALQQLWRSPMMQRYSMRKTLERGLPDLALPSLYLRRDFEVQLFSEERGKE